MKNSENNNIFLGFSFQFYAFGFSLSNEQNIPIQISIFSNLNSFPCRKRKQLGHSSVGAAASNTVFCFAKSQRNHGLAFCGGSDIGSARIEMNTRKEGCYNNLPLNRLGDDYAHIHAKNSFDGLTDSRNVWKYYDKNRG